MVLEALGEDGVDAAAVSAISAVSAVLAAAAWSVSRIVDDPAVDGAHQDDEDASAARRPRAR